MIRVIVTGLGGLRDRVRGWAERTDRLPMPEILEVMKSQIREEFAAETWHGPYGKRAWEPRKQFGSRTPSSPPLGGALSAWMAAGTTTARTAELRVGGEAGKQIAYHRGGGQSSLLAAASFSILRAKKPARQSKYGPDHPAYYAMWHYLRLNFGVTVSLERLLSGFQIPHRKHATRNPEMTRIQSEIISNHILHGKAVPGAVSS